MKPMMSAPITGTTITNGPRVCASGVINAVLNRWKKNRFVKSPISLSRPRATNAPTMPMPTANRLMRSNRGVAVKSPRLSAGSRSCLSIPAESPFAGVVEEHGRLARGGLHAVHDALQERGQFGAGFGGDLLNRADQLLLR